MQNKQLSSDTISIEKSEKLIREIATFSHTHFTSSQNHEIAEKIILGIPMELAKTIFPVIISIALFFIGFFINSIMVKRRRKRELESIKTTVTTWIDLIDKPITSQIEYCKTFAENLRKSTDLQPESLSLNQLHASKIQELNLKQLNETFVINLEGTESQKAKDLFNLVSQIEYFSKIELRLPEAYKVYQDHTYTLMEKWNNSLIELQKFIDHMDQQIGAQLEHPSYRFLRQINSRFNLLRENNLDGASLHITKIQLLDPLFELANTTIINNPNDFFATVFITKLQELMMVFKRKVTHFEGNAKVFEAYVSNMKLTHEVLKTTSDNLKKSKFPSIWKIK